jgi:hypothetical protein
VVGPRTVWPGEKTCALREVAAKDGIGETILFMEMPDSDIQWMEPRDLSFDELCDKMTPEERGKLFNAHDGLSEISFTDGHQGAFSDRFLEKNVKAMLTVDGCEKIDMDNDPGPSFRLNMQAIFPLWAKLFSLVILIGTALFIIYRPLPKKVVPSPVDEAEEIRLADTSEPEMKSGEIDADTSENGPAG